MCPLEGKCLTESVVYKAKIFVEDNEQGNYVGISEREVKGRIKDHITSFTHRKYEFKTDLSKKMWSLKDLGKNPSVTWSILRKVKPYEAGAKMCNLCLWEKFYIMREGNLINKRNELVSKCRHQNKFLLEHHKKAHPK